MALLDMCHLKSVLYATRTVAVGKGKMGHSHGYGRGVHGDGHVRGEGWMDVTCQGSDDVMRLSDMWRRRWEEEEEKGGHARLSP